jgi:hypothetical protein
VRTAEVSPGEDGFSARVFDDGDAAAAANSEPSGSIADPQSVLRPRGVRTRALFLLDVGMRVMSSGSGTRMALVRPVAFTISSARSVNTAAPRLWTLNE